MYELVLMDSCYPRLIFEQSLCREDVLPFSTIEQHLCCDTDKTNIVVSMQGDFTGHLVWLCALGLVHTSQNVPEETE